MRVVINGLDISVAGPLDFLKFSIKVEDCKCLAMFGKSTLYKISLVPLVDI